MATRKQALKQHAADNSSSSAAFVYDNCYSYLIEPGSVSSADETVPMVKWPGVADLPGSQNGSQDSGLQITDDHPKPCPSIMDTTSDSPDGMSVQKSPHKEVSPKMNKSRNEKFHKHFKNIPDDEVVLNAYSCAYFGDILLQGSLYISPNWFCFHSRILGHEKQIEIPTSKVVNITREKTAFIIPNAIGIKTAAEKYVFGSLMSRDSTYKLMWSVWKRARSGGDMDGGDSGTENNNILPKQQPKNEFEDSSESDSSGICKHCGQLDHDHASSGCPRAGSVGLRCRDAAHKSKDHAPLLRTLGTPTAAACHLVTHVRRMPRTSLLLGVCAFLVLLLMLSAVVMTYKIMVLQAKLDSSTSWPTSEPSQLSGCTSP